jgi:hypothetical protein
MNNQLHSIKVKNGRKVIPKLKTDSIMHFVKQYLTLLSGDYNKFVFQIEQSLCPKELQAPLSSYCAQIIYFLKNYPIRKNGKVSKEAKIFVENLQSDFVHFDKHYTNIQEDIKHKYGQEICPEVHRIICDLNGAIYWFLTQYKMVITSLPVNTWISENPSRQEVEDFKKRELPLIRKHINNKPRDMNARNFFLAENNSYQITHKTQRIIPFKVLESSIRKHNLVYPRRPISIKNGLYRKIRSELKSNTLMDIF